MAIDLRKSPNGKYECKLCHLSICVRHGGYVPADVECLQERDDWYTADNHTHTVTPYIPTTSVEVPRKGDDSMAQIKMETVKYEVWHMPEKHSLPDGEPNIGTLEVLAQDIVQKLVAKGEFETRQSDSEATVRQIALDNCAEKRAGLEMRELEVRIVRPFRG